MSVGGYAFERPSITVVEGAQPREKSEMRHRCSWQFYLIRGLSRFLIFHFCVSGLFAFGLRRRELVKVIFEESAGEKLVVHAEGPVLPKPVLSCIELG